MTPLELVLAAGGFTLATGLLALLAAGSPRLASSVAALGALLGGCLGAGAAVVALSQGVRGELALSWHVPGGSLAVGIDPLSAFFLVPLFVLGALAAPYGRSYLGALPLPAAQLNLLLSAMVLVLVARHALLFLVAWEAMTLVAYLLVTFEHGKAEVRRAGWVYLIASHVAVLALVAFFLALGSKTGGDLDFAACALAWHQPASAAGGSATLVLLLALLGFGIKAGVAGLHVWLPEAHAAAPSHVSAIMSGVLIKLGVYGLLRATLLVPPGDWLGLVLAGLGLLGALFGIALALAQRDLKRTLAYSSVENVGIVLTGLGLGLLARSRGQPELSSLAFAAGLLHVWNHAAMKGLLFLSAGSVLHATTSKDVEELGGLLRRMPVTGRAMIVGALAIAALPPLCGFTGEWLLFRALVDIARHGTALDGLAAMGGGAVLALVGGLAALCFVRLVGIVLLGSPRSQAATGAHESPRAMTAPIAILALACLAGGFVAPLLVEGQAALHAQLGIAGAEQAASALAPLAWSDLVLLLLGALALAWLVRLRERAASDGTWGCGYAEPTARMQYTGRSFAELLSTRILPRWLRSPLRVEPPRGLFPTTASFASDDTDPLTRGAYEPFLDRWGRRFARLRFLQQGNVHVYLVYILATVVVALAWVAVRDWWSP